MQAGQVYENVQCGRDETNGFGVVRQSRSAVSHHC